MPTYDLHQHLWPDSVVEVLRGRSSAPRLDGSLLVLDEGSFETDLDAHRLDRRVAELDTNGIDVAVVSLQPTLASPLDAELAAAYHEGIVELAGQSGGRIVALASGGYRAGFPGACLAAPDLFDLDAAAPVLDELDRNGAFAFVHPAAVPSRADKPAWWSAGVDYVAQMQEAYASWLGGGADRWPRLPVVFSILAGGGPFHLERLGRRGLDTRVALEAEIYLETSSYGRRALELCLQTYGVSRLVFGSDSPVIDPRTTLDEVRSFGDAITTAICAENPGRLLG
jgi:predicted TIM-barrel fold metal-dependent hydrolase